MKTTRNPFAVHAKARGKQVHANKKDRTGRKAKHKGRGYSRPYPFLVLT